MSWRVVLPPRSRRRIWVALILAFAAPIAGAQEVVTRPIPPVATPQVPPLVTPDPDFVLREGSISAGLIGKFTLARETDLSPNLHSTLSGSMALDAPGEWVRTRDLGVRKGFLLWALRDHRGRRGAIGLIGDPTTTTIHADLQTPLPAALSLQAHAQSRGSRSPEGGIRVNHANLGLRRQFTKSLIVNPRVYLYDVRARKDLRWCGGDLRIEYCGAEFTLNHEGARGNRAITRKTWQRGRMRWTLGGHLERHPVRPDRQLWECGVNRGRLGIGVFPGNTQRGFLLRAGSVQVGFCERARARQTVLGFKNVSLSVLTWEDGRREFGFGFVYGGLLRNVSQTNTGWQWHPASHRSAVEDSRLRWPGLATLAN